MKRLLLDQDIHSLSAFRTNAAHFLKQVHDTKRPMVITQSGHSAAVLLDVGQYEDLLDQLELLRDVQTAEKQAATGKDLMSHHQAKQALLRKLES